METGFLSFFVVNLKQIHIDKGITTGYSTNILQCKVEDTWFPLRSRGVTCHSHSTKIFVKVENFYSAVEDGYKFLK